MVKIVSHQDNLTLQINDECIAPAAYMTYIEEKGDYEGFKQAGYRVFCSCVFMSDFGVNEYSGVGAFKDHVWKARDVYDFSSVYEGVKKIVGDRREKVYVILRVNLNVPRWWREENPEELTLLGNGNTYMQSICSEKWKDDAKQFIQKLYEYVTTFEFSENIIGFQLAAMQTEEWIAMVTPDAGAAWDFSKPMQRHFKIYLQNKYGKGITDTTLPTIEELDARNTLSALDCKRRQKVLDYLTFFNASYAGAIKELCAYTKSIAKENLLVGVFYGYIGQLTCMLGHSEFDTVLRDKNVDFFASPFPYGERGKALDWFYHGAMDSVRLENKLWFLEADVRTHKTRFLSETNPELLPHERTRKYFERPCFQGPPTEEETLWVMLRSFSKILISKNAFWWFDMFGGWYKGEAMMKELSRMLALYNRAFKQKIEKTSEIAVVLDQRSTYYVPDSEYRNCVYQQLLALGTIGAPYDIYLSTDLEKLAGQNYKMILRLLPTEVLDGKESCGKTILEYNGEKYDADTRFSTVEFIQHMKAAGVHIFSENNIVFANGNFVCLTAASGGSISLHMPCDCRLKAFTNGMEYTGRDFVFDFQENQTELFEYIQKQ